MFKPSQSTVSTPSTTIIIRSFDDVDHGDDGDHEDGTVLGIDDAAKVDDDHDDHDDHNLRTVLGIGSGR